MLAAFNRFFHWGHGAAAEILDQKRTRRTMRMYSAEQRMKAVETFARFGCSAADTIAELGYPTRHTLRNWWKEYRISGDGFPERKRRKPKYSDEEKQDAVDHYLEHGRSLARTIGAMGYPGRETLAGWVDELAPGQRRRRGPNPEKGALPIGTKVQAVAELEARGGSAAEVAGRYGVSRTAPYVCFATLIFRFSRLIFFGFHVSRQGRTANFPNLRTCPS